MKIDLDQEKCIGAGQCVIAAPDVFDQREDDGIAFLVDEDPSEDHRGEVEQAVSVCPAMAIALRAAAAKP